MGKKDRNRSYMCVEIKLLMSQRNALLSFRKKGMQVKDADGSRWRHL